MKKLACLLPSCSLLLSTYMYNYSCICCVSALIVSGTIASCALVQDEDRHYGGGCSKALPVFKLIQHESSIALALGRC
jgi:hypothetical protein